MVCATPKKEKGGKNSTVHFNRGRNNKNASSKLYRRFQFQAQLYDP